MSERHTEYVLPWRGRTVSLGLEDVCSYFDRGIKASMQPNEFQAAGVPTFYYLTGEKPFTIRYNKARLQHHPDFRA